MASEIKPQLLKEIAAYLDTGMLCYYNKTIGELVTYPEGLENSALGQERSDKRGKIEGSPFDQ